MAAAGLTPGGFYRHFESKQKVFEEAIEHAIDLMATSMQRTASRGKRGLQSVIKDYLSDDFGSEVAAGCPFVALGSDLAPSSDEVRALTTQGFRRMVSIIADRLEDLPPDAARNRALVMLSTMIGAVTMAIVVSDPARSKAILQQARMHLTQAA